uniref:Chalcone isomerase domain-containing protein n=1 Tax=Chromera velia CCMP2878 TaxID=1169474 RepID=A0A0G4FPX8_9ALVE|eukprot:Cvel_18173.t1-p1 / transcript=Cvel_18173.t1 / gene=Cvel_18173 / organism=Chromera_velia_CCMP2878 / gene_product=hypothetical protein / transcript_product=hypothetical protein / location=Cvel_scaffold1490:36664-39250(+) / protein_length=284 / sequence_SO=supercontig / SO=protein_coding / is_pseudo=false
MWRGRLRLRPSPFQGSLAAGAVVCSFGFCTSGQWGFSFPAKDRQNSSVWGAFRSLVRPYPVALCEAGKETGQEGVKDEVLGVVFPRKLSVMTAAWQKPVEHVYVGSAPRCMQDACWFPPARAYSLGLYLKDEALKEADAKSADRNATTFFDDSVEKSLHFVFVSKKDSTHIKDGFERSLGKFLAKGEETASKQLQQFVAIIKRLEFRMGAELTVTFVPSPDHPKTIVMFKPSPEGEQTVMGNIEGNALRVAFHKLYLLPGEKGTYKYPSMTKKFIADLEAGSPK